MSVAVMSMCEVREEENVRESCDTRSAVLFLLSFSPLDSYSLSSSLPVYSSPLISIFRSKVGGEKQILRLELIILDD